MLFAYHGRQTLFQTIAYNVDGFFQIYGGTAKITIIVFI